VLSTIQGQEVTSDEALLILVGFKLYLSVALLRLKWVWIAYTSNFVRFISNINQYIPKKNWKKFKGRLYDW